MKPVSRRAFPFPQAGASQEGRVSFWRPALQMAAAVLILVGGFAAGRSWPNAAHEQARSEVSELRENGLAGTPAEVIDKIGTFADGGATRMYLQVMDLDDLDHLALLGAEVLPHV